jgi:hypothetical protein
MMSLNVAGGGDGVLRKQSPGEIASARLADSVMWLGSHAATPAEACGVAVGSLGGLVLELVRSATASHDLTEIPHQYVRQYNRALEAAETLTSCPLPFGEYSLVRYVGFWNARGCSVKLPVYWALNLVHNDPLLGVELGAQRSFELKDRVCSWMCIGFRRLHAVQSSV